MSCEIAKKTLESAESIYLVESGWTYSEDGWQAPGRDDFVSQDVAVNTQKMWDKKSLEILVASV